MAGDAALVMGVGGGLGLALVNAFAAEGFTVFAAARSASKLDALSANDRVIACDCDATEPAQVDALFARIDAPLRVAVFNAGAFERSPVVDIKPEDFERCWRRSRRPMSDCTASRAAPGPRSWI